MLVKHAGVGRADRYDRWYALLEEEINLVAAPGARLIAVGKSVADHLRRRKFPKPSHKVIHSPLAGRARGARMQGLELEFHEFEASLSLEEVVATTRMVLDESGVPLRIRDEVLALVSRSQLSESQRRLVYCYNGIRGHATSRRCSAGKRGRLTRVLGGGRAGDDAPSALALPPQKRIPLGG